MDKEISVGVHMHFDAAHRLPNYKGKCANMHGHTWHIEVEVSGPINNESSMVLDLSILKKEVTRIIDTMDHKTLNDIIPENPTCENVAIYLRNTLAYQLEVWDVKLKRIKVQEGEGGWATWES